MPRFISNSCAAWRTSIWEVCYEAHGGGRYVCFAPAGNRPEVRWSNCCTPRVLSSLRQTGSLQGITPSEVKQFLDVPRTGPATWRRKYGVLRDFFAYWRCRGKLNAVPMPLAAPKYTQTFVPYIYSRRELRLLLDAVPCCQRHAACRTSAITLRTLLLFLYGTGMRVGEALRLRLVDVDLDNGVITIRGTKFYKSRLVPLGARCGSGPSEVSGHAGKMESALPAFFPVAAA